MSDPSVSARPGGAAAPGATPAATPGAAAAAPAEPASASSRGGRALTWLRRGLALALAVAGLAATASGWLQLCDEQVVGDAVTRVCRAPRLDDGLVVAYAVVMLLALLPDLAEIGVPGVLSLRRQVDAQEERLTSEGRRRADLEERVGHLTASLSQAASARSQVSTTVGPSSLTINVPGLAAARLAAGAPAAGSAHPGPVVQARYAAAEYLLAHLLEETPESLGDARLNLFLPVDDGTRLLPALAEDEAAEGEAWVQGQGVVGQAWQEAAPVSARGPEVQAGLEGLPAARRSRYRGLTVVVAVPVLNAGGEAVGVLSAVSVDPDSDLDAEPCLDELLTRADVLARVLVDLLGWADDAGSAHAGPAPGAAPPADITLPTTRATTHEGAQWRP